MGKEKTLSPRTPSLRGKLGSCFGGGRAGIREESTLRVSSLMQHHARHQVDKILTATREGQYYYACFIHKDTEDQKSKDAPPNLTPV